MNTIKDSDFVKTTESECFAGIQSTYDYYPFGSEMPGRNYTPGSYKYGFNGQEKDNEITGIEGAHTTALFWEYDSRIGRRWNVDPLYHFSESPYMCLADNPIFFIDPFGLEATDKKPRNTGNTGQRRYKNCNYVKRHGVDNKTRNQTGDVVHSESFSQAFMNINSIFRVSSRHNTNLVPAGRWRNDQQVYSGTLTASQGNENYYRLDEVDPEAHLRKLWYEGTRETLWSPAYIDVDGLMPGGYKNVFNSNTFQGFPNIHSRQVTGTVDPQAILGTSQYIGGYKTLFFGTAGLLYFQTGVNRAYGNVSNIRTTSYITQVTNITVNYQVRRFQYYINSTKPNVGHLRPRFHRWLYGQPNWSTN